VSLPLLVAFIFIALSLGVFLIFLLISRRGPRVRERVRSEGESDSGTSGASPQQVFEKSSELLRRLGEMVPRSPQDLSAEEQRLVQAGIRRKDAVYLLYGVRVILIGLLLLIFASTKGLYQNPLLYILISILLGALIPDLWLRRQVSQRKWRIQMGLPDFMDLSVVCVEAGLGLDQTIQRVGKEIKTSYPDLSGELRLYGLEVTAGRSRSEALRNLAGRTGVDDLRGLTAVLIQSDRFGTSIADSLRIFAEDLRVKRRQRAEEMAAKMGVKMVPPLVLFIFPAVFAVILGPAIVLIVRNIFEALGRGPQ
jgi:tight adherence protein C